MQPRKSLLSETGGKMPNLRSHGIGGGEKDQIYDLLLRAENFLTKIFVISYNTQVSRGVAQLG